MPRLIAPGKKVDRVVRIVLALLSLLTAHRPARAGQERTAQPGPAPPAPYQAGRFGAGTGDRPRWPAQAARRRPPPRRSTRRAGAAGAPAGPPGGRLTRPWPTPAAAAHPGHLGHDPGAGRAHLPQGDRVRGPGRAVRRPAPGGPQRAPAERAVRLAVAGRHRGDHDQHRSRARGCCRRSRASPSPRSARRTSTSTSPARCPRTSARGRAGTPARSTPSGTRRPRWT